MRLAHLEAIKRAQLTQAERTGDPEAISAELLSLEGSRRTRENNAPRASSLYKECMRKYVLCAKHSIPEYENVVFSRQLTFDIGNAIHYWLQNSKNYFGNQRRGHWKCRACGRVTLFSKPRVTPCACGALPDAYEYNETHMRIVSPYEVSGHPDLFIEPPQSPGRVRIVEFKTMNGDGFEKLAAPLIEHQWQVNTYMWMCDEDPTLLPATVDTSLAYIVYISKKEKYGQLPLKTFLVKKEPFILEAIQKKLKQFHDGMRQDTLPDILDVCHLTKFTHATAKYCAARDFCSRLQ